MPGRQLDVGDLINRQRFSAPQWRILILCFLIVLCDGFDTAAIGYIAPAVIRDWGVARSQLGPVMSAALWGLAAGAMLAGPLADRVGRKRVLMGAVLLFGAMSLAASRAPDLSALAWLRFATGLGLGAAMANAVTLMSEYSPEPRRAFIVSAMFCGFPLGAACGGLLASWLVPHAGWRSVLLVGGVAPLLLLPAMWLLLPESLRFLLLREGGEAAARRILLRLLPGVSLRDGDSLVLREGDKSRGLRLVWSASYRTGTLLLAAAYFMGLLIFYLLTSWLPILISDSGMDLSRAALLTALFPFGGLLGSTLTGWLMDRYDGHRVLAAAYLLTGLLVFAIGQSLASHGWLALAICLAGIAMNGAQASMPSLAAGYYPTAGRASGVAWMMGIGRFGGIAGAMLGAVLLKQQLSLPWFFALLSLPALLAAAALLLKRRAVAQPGRAWA
ncbi:aromatic acid/H+ symport family MFS transporter [Chromobacterium phragmitis]|uniref:Aromatic acid/H+ symport family MFS transporter n=2 Tax=Chromobacterium phragmitis TaxID=2202141 RepID=A0A344UGE5_9NEIS|nr:MFS transporter [Chromobacterium phragmitis]AXE28983.1 aromatic acid/H+ symport family MFS transporter [Chromobacterium phragmitis]AXE34343.1 aromatic acid/H+ symport family MFS transporter [Chromobacterium phragmitis]